MANNKAKEISKGLPKAEGHDFLEEQDAPGSTIGGKGDMVFEGLGDIAKFVSPATKNAEGSGEKCVVLMDVVSGEQGIPYLKGQVVRISKLIRGYNDDDQDEEQVKTEIKRLFVLKAIRKANLDEQELSHVDIPMGGEGVDVLDERAKRIAMEEELLSLRAQLAKTEAVAESLTPTTGGQAPTEGGQTAEEFLQD